MLSPRRPPASYAVAGSVPSPASALIHGQGTLARLRGMVLALFATMAREICPGGEVTSRKGTYDHATN